MADQGKVEEIDKSVSSGHLSALIPPPFIPVPSSSSAAANLNYNPYPPPIAKYEDLLVDPKLFMETLQKLHGAMGTKFMIPIIGGRDLDLHKLFVEVTSRGGVEKILREKKWKEVTATFNFPSTATNASFILRKHYFSLLHHYEQIYYFKAKGWTPIPHGSWQSAYAIPIAVHGGVNSASTPTPAPALQPQAVIRPPEPVPQDSNSSFGSQVTGVIDGKFEGGYLVTVSVNSGPQKLKGVLYHIAPTTTGPTHQAPQPQNTAAHLSQGNSNVVAHPHCTISVTPPVMKRRRRRRKKSEIKRRDPAHPKPNRSGYNFFFAEQHARLKPLYQGRDREISRIIGELWTSIKEDEKAVYQEKAVKDKERYMSEMEGYKEKLRLGQVISNAIPIQQRLPNLDAQIADAETKEVAEKDYSETFEDDEEDDDDEEEDECSMSMSEYEEDAEEPVEGLNAEVSEKAEPIIIQASHGVEQSSVEEAAEAALLLSKGGQTSAEQVQEQEVKSSTQ